MTTRIRYSEYENLLQTDWFTVGPNLVVRGIIDTKDFTYRVTQLGGELVVGGGCSNLRDAKSALKLALSGAGVNFVGEIRNRRNKV
jgi:hypothetical protein